jgi:ABC-type amino acid transport system permease subunit
VVAEVYRAGVLAVPRGQTDAARSLGLTEAQVFFSIVFPQALRYIVRHWSRNWSSWSRTPPSATS